MGIINDIYERDNFMENVMEYARQFTPPNKAAKAVGNIKRSVQTGWEIPLESALAVERELQQRLFASEDAKEGLAAYVDKRPATFKAKCRHPERAERVEGSAPERMGWSRPSGLRHRETTAGFSHCGHLSGLKPVISSAIRRAEALLHAAVTG
jgi:hypothetical protein